MSEQVALAQASPVAAAIRAAKAERKGALVGYLPVGFPDLDTSVEAAIAMARSGADVLEFGVPYSDPVMDGQVIQEATQTALANGFKLRDLFDAEVDKSDAVIASMPSLDTLSVRPSKRTDGHFNLRWVLVHLIEEYARHNGHADLIREAIDGSVGT